MGHSGTFMRLKRAIELQAYKIREKYIELMDVFLLRQRINTEEYEELMEMLDKYFPVERK